MNTFKTIRRQFPALLQVSLASLWRSKWASATVVLCVTLVVLVLLGFLAMAEGYRRSLDDTGATDIAILLSDEANAESSSHLTRDDVALLAGAPGIARDAQGAPELSAEFGMTVGLANPDGRGRQNVTVRGMDPAGLALRAGLHLVEGRMFQPGHNEIVVGRRLAAQSPALRVGATARLAGRDWLVVGTYAVDAALFESEAWADIAAVQAAWGRQNQFQSVRVRLAGPDTQAAVAALADFVAKEPRLKLSVQTERGFFQAQSAGTHDLLVYIGWPLAAVLAAGTVAGTFNTMSIAVQSRRRSLRALNLLGFDAAVVAACVLAEALLLSTIGAIVGGAIGWLAFNGVHGVTVGAGFTSVHFDWRLGAASLLQALLLALTVGAFGGLLPAWRTLRTRQGAAL